MAQQSSTRSLQTCQLHWIECHNRATPFDSQPTWLPRLFRVESWLIRSHLAEHHTSTLLILSQEHGVEMVLFIPPSVWTIPLSWNQYLERSLEGFLEAYLSSQVLSFFLSIFVVKGVEEQVPLSNWATNRIARKTRMEFCLKTHPNTLIHIYHHPLIHWTHKSLRCSSPIQWNPVPIPLIMLVQRLSASHHLHSPTHSTSTQTRRFSLAVTCHPILRSDRQVRGVTKKYRLPFTTGCQGIHRTIYRNK